MKHNSQLTEILNRIAEKEINNDMDKLQEIRAQILNRHRRRIQRWPAAAAAAILVIIFSGFVVYAWVQSIGDPGLNAVDEAGLVTEMNQSQTIDDITITIIRGYADANRTALWYRVEGINPQDNYQINARLLDAITGTIMFGGQGGYAMEEADEDVLLGLMTFDHAEDVAEDTVFDLILEITLEPMLDVTPESAVGPFEFTISLPVIEALELVPQETITTNGITMTLESMRITPSATSLRICYDLPDTQDWQPDIALVIGEEEGLLSSMSVVMPFDPQNLYRCMDIGFVSVYVDASIEILTVTVPHLQTSIQPTPEILAAAKERLAEQGIAIEFTVGDHGMGWDILSAPDDLGEDELGVMIWDSMRIFHEGPWIFEITLP